MLRKSVRRKAQASTSALFALIGLLIVLYIMFIPAEDRNKLLDDDNDNNGDDDDDLPVGVLLEEFPGTLEPQLSEDETFDLPPLNLKSSESSSVFADKNALLVSRTIFASQTAYLDFSTEDPQNTDDLLLSFTVKEGSERLTITLNEETVFQGSLEAGNVNPIKLDKRLLEENNQLEFSVSSPGLAFWKTNEYALEALQVSGNIERVGGLRARSTFFIDDGLLEPLKDARFEFLPDCNIRAVDPLEVKINEREVFSGIPDCGVLHPVSLDPDVLLPGRNNVEFSTTKGTYIIDQISTRLRFNERVNPLFFFELEEDEVNNITDGDYDINVTLEFAGDEEEDKRAQLVINNKFITIDEEGLEFSVDIGEHVKTGNNALELIPRERLNVVTLRVIYEEEE